MLELARDLPLQFIIPDRNSHIIERAKRGVLEELYGESKGQAFAQAFERKENEYRIMNVFRQDVQFLEQGIHFELTEGTFDIILCNNLVFTFLQEDLQWEVFHRIMINLNPCGYLNIDNHESLPEGK